MSLKLSKIYTRGGDHGTTALVGGKRIKKSELRLESYGTTDELNAHIGIIRTTALDYRDSQPEIFIETTSVLKIVQNKLFDIGSLLATPPGESYPGMPTLSISDTEFLEQKIDAYNEILETLLSFTLPGGGKLNAQAHVARTVCRRAERVLARLQEKEDLPEFSLAYINRLSDYLFIYSRWVSKKLGDEEFLWDKGIH